MFSCAVVVCKTHKIKFISLGYITHHARQQLHSIMRRDSNYIRALGQAAKWSQPRRKRRRGLSMQEA
jgi:hypothetical protein